jgi:hypothetical protein
VTVENKSYDGWADPGWKTAGEEYHEWRPRSVHIDTRQTGKGTKSADNSYSDLLAAVYNFTGCFVAYPSEAAHVAHVLWIAHAHIMDAWESTPRLAFLSPEPASGKTRALEVSELLVPNPVEAVNVSPAYLFRKVGNDSAKPTILFDEIDTVFGPKAKENEEIRGLLNAGHRRGAVAGRCVVHGKTVTTEDIPAYCAVALAGLGWLPDTILTRSVIVRMRRRAPNEKITPFRRRVNAPQGHALQQQLAAWGYELADEMTEARPEMPAGIEDRDADVWEPLLAVADAAGEGWPQRARDAAVALVAVSREVEPSLGIRLLADLRTVFGSAEAMSTKSIIASLCSMEEAPWGDLKGRPLDERGLARRLRQYSVKSKNLRIVDAITKGYAGEDLHDVWRRYLDPAPSPDASATRATGATNQQNQGADVADVADNVADVADSGSQKNPHKTGFVADVAHVAHVRGNGGAMPARRCDHCGQLGPDRPYDWPGHPDGVWLHRVCEGPWFDSETATADKQTSR